MYEYPARRIGCIILINYTRQCFAKLIDRWGIMLVASTWVTLYVYIFIHGRLYMSGSVRPSGRCSVDPLVRSHFQSVNFSNGWWLWLKSTRLFTCVIALSHSPTGNLIHHISLKLTSDNKSSIGGHCSPTICPPHKFVSQHWNLLISLSLSFLLQKSNCND